MTCEQNLKTAVKKFFCPAIINRFEWELTIFGKIEDGNDDRPQVKKVDKSEE